MRVVRRRQRTFVALTLTVVNSLLLLVWTEVQWRWLMILGLPYYSGSGGHGLGSYYNMPGLQWNVPEFSLWITVVASSLLMLAAWQFTKGAQGRKRMLFLVGVCAAIAMSFSVAAVRWERTHLEFVTALHA